MGIMWNLARVCVAALIVVVVATSPDVLPAWALLLLSLPLISILAFSFSWFQHHDLRAISSMAKDTLVLVPLGLPFFVPFVFAHALGLELLGCIYCWRFAGYFYDWLLAYVFRRLIALMARD